jgi:hypothetical protein
MAVILHTHGTAIDREVSFSLGQDSLTPDFVELLLATNDGAQELRAWVPVAWLHDLAITTRERVVCGELAIEAEEGWSGYRVRSTASDRVPCLRLDPRSFRALLSSLRHLPPESFAAA